MGKSGDQQPALETRIALLEQLVKGDGADGLFDVLKCVARDLTALKTEFEEYRDSGHYEVCPYLAWQADKKEKSGSWWVKHGVIVKDITALVSIVGLITALFMKGG